MLRGLLLVAIGSSWLAATSQEAAAQTDSARSLTPSAAATEEAYPFGLPRS
jgi:hypothetical protein